MTEIFYCDQTERKEKKKKQFQNNPSLRDLKKSDATMMSIPEGEIIF